MSTIKDNFYLRLRDERDRLELSQSVIAEQCNVSRTIWGRYESGVSLPGAEVLMRLAELGADVVYLLVGVRSGVANKSDQERSTTYSSSDVENLLDVFAHTNEEGRQAFLAVAKALKKQ